MKRICILLIGSLLAVAAAATAATADRGASSAGAAGVFTVELHKTKLGKVLTTASGFTLYEFTKDGPKKDVCAKIKGCLTVWPAMESASKPTAGPGVRAALLSTIELPGGTHQVTYAGHPLYIYSDDSGPGQTAYVGIKQFGGTWEAVSASGRAVK